MKIRGVFKIGGRPRPSGTDLRKTTHVEQNVVMKSKKEIAEGKYCDFSRADKALQAIKNETLGQLEYLIRLGRKSRSLANPWDFLYLSVQSVN